MTIQLLEDNLVNKIAAGEVIERPASIVKELAENAIDAGSSKIAVSVLEGGIQSIEVEDDGNGIPDQELALAFERHATSKLMQEEDLVTIQTMGFRGEALPSIASVSKMEFFTRAQGHKGMRAIVEAGTMADIGEFPVPFGSRVVVNEIFFNTPVRRKF
ncbi:MAG: DNA mismatch repair endonuclease MutL, partial [Bacillota bacterium]|nr:DNA mismatch repair endonuclease MutL [Bacillota bacterium]